jgi:cell division transport system permease protein
VNHLLGWVLQALRGIRSGLLIQLAATGAIAMGLLLVGLAVLGALNVDRLTRNWGRGVQAIVYLRPDAPPERVRALVRLLQGRPEVVSVRSVTSADAYRRLEESLGGRRGLLAGVERDFLPASLEISLSAQQSDQVRPLLALLGSSALVEEVDHIGAWADRLSSLVALLRLAGLAVALIVSFACLYIVASTIRLGVHARREQIEILKLVGATDRFVRVPFLIEGTLQGLVGAMAAGGLLFLIFRFAASRLEAALSAALSHVQLGFLSPSQLALGLLAGALLGLFGSRLALGRYVDV